MPSQPGKPSHYIPFTTGHDDLIHDVCYDFYGKRIVTCSSDQRLKIFDLNDEGEWIQSESWKAHDGSISKVIWGHPEHGHIIASCSNDRTVRIWEEQEFEPKSSARRWKKQYTITLDVAIYDISFAPVHRGLKLASISNSGYVYIHEAPEPQDPTIWMSQEQIQILRSQPPRETEQSFVVEYCPSRWGGEQLAVGAMDTVRIYRQQSNGKYKPMEELKCHKNLVRGIAWAPTMGRSYHLIATACKDGHVRIFKLTEAKSHSFSSGRSRGALNTGGGSGRTLDEPLTPGGMDEDEEDNEDFEGSGNEYNVEMIADFDDHRKDVWRVKWNATGTILISGGDDGKIRLWKATLNGEFRCMSAVSSRKGE
ncbi:WD40 repeat-like protein [Terfezia boudieri ATCC MYA-4762]|uniref:WD40 repeat-like protein n=1 Tax=Terfezia boudieri ATCC MYA-4762 TaxID=1051890 RepID=A0A3N4LLE6_9PEZI|nr:WD40 repeat-like protein [Terfezia boudieri ATCC MYA-4762]